MTKKKFNVDDLREIGYSDSEFVEVERKISDQDRWSTYYDLVFKFKDKFYFTTYSVGSTEYQDEIPWEGQEEVDCIEVYPYEVTAVRYMTEEQFAEFNNKKR